MTSIATVTKTSARSRGPASTTNAIVPMSSPSRNGTAKSVRPTELGRLKVRFPDVSADRPCHDAVTCVTSAATPNVHIDSQTDMNRNPKILSGCVVPSRPAATTPAMERATGVALSIAGVVAAGLLGTTQPERIFGFLFMSVWLSIWTFGVAALVTQVTASWHGRSADTSGKRTFSLPSSVGLTLFAVPFLLGELIGTIAFVVLARPLLLPLVFVTASIDVSFFPLLRAYTPHGRALLDQIDGFRLYLSVAEKDRMNMLTPVDHTPETFERYLPYALALDVEQQWSESFADVLERTDASGQLAYHPVWFSGGIWRSTTFSTLGSSLSGAFASAIAASSVAPGKSSGFGGGGGSSGGGGDCGRECSRQR